jgi:enoyl-CoA hydratase/carnithine racemase
LLIEDRGRPVLTMNRPEKRNALNNALTRRCWRALRAADADDAVNVIVLTGAGRVLRRRDLSEFKDLTSDNQPLVERRAQLTMSLHEIFPRLTKPVITAINGAAMGGGAGLALAGDLALMAESAKLGYPEVKHGIVAAIVMPNLVRQVGRKAAFELLATGQPVGARRALELGMVNRVVPDAELMVEALKLAGELAAVSRPAMA